MKKNKNIAFICEGLSYEYGGQAVSIPSLGNALAKNSNVNYFVTESETDRISIIDKSSRVFFCKAFGKKLNSAQCCSYYYLSKEKILILSISIIFGTLFH